jgi:hypothetical protein
VNAVHHLFDLTETVREIDAAAAGTVEKDDEPDAPARGTSSAPAAPNEAALGSPGGRETLGR